MPKGNVDNENSVRVILADDLTGACDTAVRIVGAHRRVAVSLNHQPASFNGYDYVAVNSNTRSLGCEETSVRLHECVRRIEELGASICYKKIDSLLRGNIVTEMEFLMKELGFDAGLIAPGYPENNRLVIDGELYPNGKNAGAHRSVLETLHLSDKTAVLSGELLKKGVSETVSYLEEKYREGFRFFIGDSADNEELKVLAETVSRTDLKILPAGSAGLAKYLFPENDETSAGTEVTGFRDSAIAFIVGSGNPVTVQQVQKLIREVIPYSLTFEKKIEGAYTDKRSVVVTTKDVLEGRPVCGVDAIANISNRDIERSLSERAKELYDAGIRRMVITGGDTAQVVLQSMGFSEIEILYESEPGIVLGIARGEKREPIVVVTKSGGFGSPEAFVKLEKILRDVKGERNV